MKNYIVLSIFLFQSFCLGADNSMKSIAMLMVVKGSVQVVAANGSAEPGKVGLQLFEGDQITVANESLAKIITHDRNVLVVAANSDLKIETYKNEEQKPKRVVIDLKQGALRSSLTQTYKEEGEYYRVLTPTALAGVRGTDFLTEYNPAKAESTVCTFTGKVAMQEQKAGVPSGQEQIVTKGNFARQKFGEAFQVQAAKPSWIQNKMQALEVKRGEGLNVKPIERKNGPSQTGGGGAERGAGGQISGPNGNTNGTANGANPGQGGPIGGPGGGGSGGGTEKGSGGPGRRGGGPGVGGGGPGGGPGGGGPGGRPRR